MFDRYVIAPIRQSHRHALSRRMAQHIYGVIEEMVRISPHPDDVRTILETLHGTYQEEGRVIQRDTVAELLDSFPEI